MSEQPTNAVEAVRARAGAAKSTLEDTGKQAKLRVDTAVSALPDQHEQRVRHLWDVVARSFGVAYRTRVTGLAAEGAYWVVFATPWLLFGIVALLGRVENFIGKEALLELQDKVLIASSEFLTPEAVDHFVKPMVESILSGGASSIGFVGFLVALYAGSRLVNCYVDGITIVYGQSGHRGFVPTRLLSFAMYVVGLFAVVVVMPVLVLAQPLLRVVAPGSEDASLLLTVAQVVLVLALLTSLYNWAVPHRTTWRQDLPGAIVAMAIWFAGSWALGIYFAYIFRAGSVYAAISAPIAVLLWAYVTSLTVFLGAAVNTALRHRRERIHPDEKGPDGNGD